MKEKRSQTAMAFLKTFTYCSKKSAVKGGTEAKGGRDPLQGSTGGPLSSEVPMFASCVAATILKS